MAKTYRCKQSFVIGAGGANRVIRAGDIVAANDPRFKQHKHLFESKYFESSDDFIERTVEQATAEPGERRSLTKPVRKAAKKATAKPKAADDNTQGEDQ